ncbi:PGF-pre-PGF domain-containing protein [Methanococcoides sp. SA1]|nr:PGF-pre-PGF domain-containing protein [Methanococcoides sp. SA1]
MKLHKNSIDLSGMILKITIVAIIAAIFSVSALAIDASASDLIDLNETDVGTSWINWTWTNPTPAEFNHTALYLNNEFRENVSNETTFYKVENLDPGTSYELSTQTVDLFGNVSSSWINDTAITKTPLSANFTSNVTSGKQPLNVQFIDSSIAAETWTWDFGDGYGSNTQNPIHTYITPGDYTVILAVTNSDSVGANVFVRNDYIKVQAVLPPVADFVSNSTAGTEPLPVRFEDRSSNALTWKWDFGDGSASNEKNPIHTNEEPGLYNVSLNVSNTDGYDHILKNNFINVTVLPTPVAIFTANKYSGDYPLTVSFTNQSIYETSWEWDFGDGSTSIDPNPSHTYVAAGNYTVSLTVSNRNGNDSTSKLNYITVSTPTNDPDSSSNSGSSSGGGGGGSSVSSERYENILVKAVTSTHMIKGMEKPFTFNNEMIDITYIIATADFNVGNVKAIVESLNTTSSLVSKPPEGRVYKNINIWLGDYGFEKKLIDSSIGFRVEKTWLKENSVPEFSVSMVVYKDNNWNILPTEKIGEDDTYIYYEATTSEIYSSFAIVEPVQKEATTSNADSSLTENSVDSDASKASPSLEVSEEGEGTALVVKTESKASSVKFILFVIPLLIIISLSYVAFTRGYHIEAKTIMSAFLEEMKAENINDISSGEPPTTKVVGFLFHSPSQWT